MPSRRAHVKSRHGCRQCKARRVKVRFSSHNAFKISLFRNHGTTSTILTYTLSTVRCAEATMWKLFKTTRKLRVLAEYSTLDSSNYCIICLISSNSGRKGICNDRGLESIGSGTATSLLHSRLQQSVWGTRNPKDVAAKHSKGSVQTLAFDALYSGPVCPSLV
jgi:hypothetical protein